MSDEKSKPRRAFICYGMSGSPHLSDVIDWCSWLVRHTSITYTIYWSSYVSEIGDQVLDESLALIEGHTHVVVLGEETDRTQIQKGHAIACGVSAIDLTMWGLKSPAPDSEAHTTLQSLLHQLLEA